MCLAQEAPVPAVRPEVETPVHEYLERARREQKTIVQTLQNLQFKPSLVNEVQVAPLDVYRAGQEILKVV